MTEEQRDEQVIGYARKEIEFAKRTMIPHTTIPVAVAERLLMMAERQRELLFVRTKEKKERRNHFDIIEAATKGETFIERRILVSATRSSHSPRSLQMMTLVSEELLLAMSDAELAKLIGDMAVRAMRHEQEAEKQQAAPKLDPARLPKG